MVFLNNLVVKNSCCTVSTVSFWTTLISMVGFPPYTDYTDILITSQQTPFYPSLWYESNCLLAAAPLPHLPGKLWLSPREEALHPTGVGRHTYISLFIFSCIIFTASKPLGHPSQPCFLSHRDSRVLNQQKAQH